MKKIILEIINLYQNIISPNLGNNCRFFPSCSQYTYNTIEKYGITKGLFRGIKRLTKCHPWNLGGIDLP